MTDGILRQWLFRKTGIVETLASHAEIGVLSAGTGGACRGSGGITFGKILRLQSSAFLAGKWFATMYC